MSSGPFGYSLPIWLGFDEETVDVEEGGVYFVESSEFFEVTINKGELLEGGYVRFENGFDYTVDLNFNLTGGLDEVVSLEYGSLNDVEPGEIVSLGLNVNGVEAGNYEGYVVLSGIDFEDNFLIKVNVLDVEDEVVVNGTVDGGDEVVDLNITESEDESDGFKLGAWFWIILFVVVVGLLIFWRYKKKKIKETHPFFQN